MFYRRWTVVGFALALLATGGCANVPHHVDLYIKIVGDDCDVVDIEGDKAVSEVYVLPGDLIVFFNTLPEDEVTVSTTVSGLFAADSYVMPPRSRLALPVLEGAAGIDFEVTLDCGDGGLAGPSIVVGTPP